MVLGSGLGGLAADVEESVSIPFAELPGWPATTRRGTPDAFPRRPALGGVRSSCSRAASHSYEGNAAGPRRAAGPALQGPRRAAVILTNAAGGLDRALGRERSW